MARIIGIRGMPFELDSPNDEFPLVVWRKKKKGKEGTVWKTSAENRAFKRDIKRDRHLIVDTYLSSAYQFGYQRLMEI
jgi:hypothetical protein